jgi:hypothetical protein
MKRPITILQASILLREMYTKSAEKSWTLKKVIVEEVDKLKILVVIYEGNLIEPPRKIFRDYLVEWRAQ